jgi:ABC-type Na+ transport system ATPase subunit NatA
MELAISVHDLRKNYGATLAVRGISFDVARGEVFGLLGGHGAGKTTTLEILDGHRPRTAGDVRVLGTDPGRPTREWRERIGLVLQDGEHDPSLTVRETVTQFAGLYPHPRRVDETIALARLGAKRDVLVGELSAGERRRVDIAAGIVGDPELLFIDEPTAGFDPPARGDAWGMVDGMRELGRWDGVLTGQKRHRRTIRRGRCGRPQALPKAVANALGRLCEGHEISIGITQHELARAPFALLDTPFDLDEIADLFVDGIDVRAVHVEASGKRRRVGPWRLAAEELQDGSLALKLAPRRCFLGMVGTKDESGLAIPILGAPDVACLQNRHRAGIHAGKVARPARGARDRDRPGIQSPFNSTTIPNTSAATSPTVMQAVRRAARGP